MIFLDSNVFMYAAGVAHPHKHPSANLLQRVAAGDVAATTNTEIFQEILHRYRAIGRWEDGKRVYLLARRIVPVVELVTMGILDEAQRLLDKHPSLMARDGLHAATCLSLGAMRMCSYDTDYDVISHLKRQTPDQVLAKL